MYFMSQVAFLREEARYGNFYSFLASLRAFKQV